MNEGPKLYLRPLIAIVHLTLWHRWGDVAHHLLPIGGIVAGLRGKLGGRALLGGIASFGFLAAETSFCFH